MLLLLFDAYLLCSLTTAFRIYDLLTSTDFCTIFSISPSCYLLPSPISYSDPCSIFSSVSSFWGQQIGNHRVIGYDSNTPVWAPLASQQSSHSLCRAGISGGQGGSPYRAGGRRGRRCRLSSARRPPGGLDGVRHGGFTRRCEPSQTFSPHARKLLIVASAV